MHQEASSAVQAQELSMNVLKDTSQALVKFLEFAIGQAPEQLKDTTSHLLQAKESSLALQELSGVLVKDCEAKQRRLAVVGEQLCVGSRQFPQKQVQGEAESSAPPRSWLPLFGAGASRRLHPTDRSPTPHTDRSSTPHRSVVHPSPIGRPRLTPIGHPLHTDRSSTPHRSVSVAHPFHRSVAHPLHRSDTASDRGNIEDPDGDHGVNNIFAKRPKAAGGSKEKEKKGQGAKGTDMQQAPTTRLSNGDHRACCAVASGNDADHLSVLRFMRRLSCNCPPFSAAGTLACTRVADATEEGVAKHRISDHKSLAKKCMMNVELATQLATSAKPVGSSKEDEELKTNYSSGGKRQPWSCHTYQKGNGKMTKVRHICPPIVRPHIHGSFARTSPIPLPAQSDRSLHLTDRFSPIGRSSPIGPHRSVSVLTDRSPPIGIGPHLTD